MDRFFDGAFLALGWKVIAFAVQDQEDRIDPLIKVKMWETGSYGIGSRSQVLRSSNATLSTLLGVPSQVKVHLPQVGGCEAGGARCALPPASEHRQREDLCLPVVLVYHPRSAQHTRNPGAQLNCSIESQSNSQLSFYRVSHNTSCCCC